MTKEGKDFFDATKFFVPSGEGVKERFELPTVPPTQTSEHERLKSIIKEVGEVLAKHVELEYKAPPYTYDVVWRDIEALPPTHVFEVQDKGNLDVALPRLQHARDMWKPKLFLVVTGERDRDKARQLLEPYWRGAFHRLAKHTVVLGPIELEDIYKVFTSRREIIRQLLEE